MTTLKDIAIMANVSVNTVSRVLNGKSKDIWPRARQQADEIRAIAKELNYIPNSAARAMRAQKFHRVGFVISGKYTAPVDFELIMGASNIFKEQGYSLSVICVDELKAGDSILGKDSLDGIIVRHIDSAFREEVRKLSPNCVWVDTNVFEKVNCIRRDEFFAGQLAAREVLNLGYKSIIYIEQLYNDQTADQHFCNKDRCEGVTQEINLMAQISFEKISLPKENRFGPLVSVFNAKRNQPTAIIASDVHVAEEVTFFALGKGLCAGKDFALISCDERENIRQIWPDLSRVKYQRGFMGKKAAEMLLALIREEPPKKSLKIKDEWWPGKTALPIL